MAVHTTTFALWQTVPLCLLPEGILHVLVLFDHTAKFYLMQSKLQMMQAPVSWRKPPHKSGFFLLQSIEPNSHLFE